MPKNNRIYSAVLLVFGLAFVVGIVYLLILRFGQGDVYPAYSSLRQDPLGTRALHDSLAELGGRKVRRNFLPLERMAIDNGATVLYLGAKPVYGDRIHKDVFKKFDRITDSGGRLVVAFYPENDPMEKAVGDTSTTADDPEDAEQYLEDKKPDKQAPGPAGDGDGGQGAEPDDADHTRKDDHFTSIERHWGLAFSVGEKSTQDKDAAFSGQAVSGLRGLPDVVSWHSALHFGDLDASWQILYTTDDRPVVIERQFGNGSIIFLSDAYLFSNQALRAERYPQLLAYVIGPNPTIVFDESHFGITRRQGVADLVRLYRFHWFFLAVILLAALFVWKNAVHFIPMVPGTVGTDTRREASQMDYTHGLIGLLRRYIPKGQVLQVCLQEFMENEGRVVRIPGEKMDRIRSMAATLSKKDSKENNPVRVYQSISRILKRKSI